MSIDRSPEKEENACPRWRGSKRWGVKATGYFALSALSGWCLWCEHARGETFWLSCLLVAAVIAGIFYALSRIGGRCDTLYFGTQDCERAQRLRDEIERGQRYGRLVARCAQPVWTGAASIWRPESCRQWVGFSPRYSPALA